MTEEPPSVSTETLANSLAPSSLAINSTTTQLVMASKGPQRKLLSPPTATSGSENCNPNVIHGSCKRKINNCPKSNAAGQLLESSNTPKHLTSQACAEFNLISPPRKHVCSSRRCASKNPDYAVPATVNPKKFLVSKRHELPPKGATMCKCCLRKGKGEVSAADDQLGGMEVCSRCSDESQKRRWSSDDSACRQLADNGEPTAFSLTSSERHGREALHYPDSGQIEQASMNEAVRLPASETAHQERSTDTPKSWNRRNDSSNLQANHVDTQDHHLNAVSDVFEDSTPPTALAAFSGSCGSQSKHRAAYFNKRELQASPLPAGEGLYRFAGEGLYRFGASSTPEQSSLVAADDGNPSLMPENEEEAISPSPEKSGNWRLNAVLESFGNLSPTREGRVKTLVRAFESLLSVTERKVEQQARKPGGFPLKFSYLRSNANVEGEENTQREDFTYGGEGESENEEATDEEEGLAQWQTNLSKGDVKDEEIGDRWRGPHAVPVYSQSVVEGEQCPQEREVAQECVESREEAVSHEEENRSEKLLQKQEAQELNARSVVGDEDKGGKGEQWQLLVVEDDEKCGMGKQWQEHKAEQESAQSLRVRNEEAHDLNAQPVVGNEDKGGMGRQWERLIVGDDKKHGMGRRRWQELEAERESAQSLQEEVGEMGGMAKLSQKQQEEDKGKQPDEPNEHQAEGVYAQTLNKGKQPHELEEHQADGAYAQTVKKDYETDKGEQQALDNVSTQKHFLEGEVLDVPVFSANPMEDAFERQLPTKKIRTNIQQRSSQISIDGHFARKKQSSRIRESRRGSNCSISSIRPPLVQKSQTQSAPDKPRFSKPQPFKLLTEARGNMKEQEFMMRLRKILEEEEKLRVPLAQGLPWTTDEPEIPYKPPVKENTKPLDIQLNSDLRAMERAEFDRFIAEKLLYIEERRLEEECRRRAAEEEEIKRMRQEMVPKAQLMPYFDRPFRPIRSSKRPTIPKEPQFHVNKQPKRQKCVANST